MIHKLAGIMMSAFFVLCQNISAQTLTPENQVIALRHIIEQTNNPAQQEAALKLMANAGTYQALTYATSLLEDEQIGQEAAKTVWTILANHPEFNGKETRQTLDAILPMLKGKDKKQAKAWDALNKSMAKKKK